MAFLWRPELWEGRPRKLVLVRQPYQSLPDTLELLFLTQASGVWRPMDPHWYKHLHF